MKLPGLGDLFAALRPKPAVPFSALFKKFKSILGHNNAILELMADMGDKLGGEYVFDRQYILSACESLADQVFKLISDLSLLCHRRNAALFTAFERIQHQVREELAGRRVLSRLDHILPLSELTHALADEGGNKMSNLGDVRNILGHATPEGFVITAGAYFEAMEKAGLRRRAAEAARNLRGGLTPGLLRECEDIRKALLVLPLPRSLARSIQQAARELSGPARTLLAVRSSAWEEDCESSYAGMYATVLGVRPEDILAAYREVLASLFCEEALAYRSQRGGQGQEAVMAVGVMRMVPALVSGGLYTYAPLTGEDAPMVASAAWGLGKPIVDGTAETDTFILRRDPPHAVLSRDICPKTTRLAIDPRGGTREEDVPEQARSTACLDDGQLARLAEAGMALERFFKRPLDVEWAFTPAGELFVLQARPLAIRPRREEACPDPSEAARDARVLFSGRGFAAMGGVASGRVRRVGPDEDPASFPPGAVLVAHHSSPRFARILHRCKAVLTEVGSATGHMATIARELRVPTVVGAGDALAQLSEGQVITLDADHNVVYDGAVEALCRAELVRQDVFEESWEYRTLKRALKHISPLTLPDPRSEDFRPENCKTFHDITRYIHQRAVDKLISLAETHRGLREGAPKKLLSRLPLGLNIIDVEEGLAPVYGEEVREEDIRCRPLAALLQGMALSGMWETAPVAVDMGSFMSSVTRTLSAHQSHPSVLGRNLAVVSREYLNLHLRLGYHFTVVDAYLGESVNDNTIFFRFMGGVTELTRRSRRAVLVGAVLERYDFMVKISGDMVTGRVKKHPTGAMLDRLTMLGALIGYTRQLDAKLDSEESVDNHLREFMQRLARPGGPRE
jgi:pyruvate,water dikinase